MKRALNRFSLIETNVHGMKINPNEEETSASTQFKFTGKQASQDVDAKKKDDAADDVIFVGKYTRNENPNHMIKKTIIKPAKSPAAIGPYNHAVRTGDLLFCAGQIPIDPQDGSLVAGDVTAQTERVLQNVKAILDDQGLTFANVVKTTVFITNLAEFGQINDVYAKHFTENYPARSTVQVANLPKGAKVEIEVVAHC